MSNDHWNPSTDAMARRKAGISDAVDFFPTHPWAIRALLEHMNIKGKKVRFLLLVPVA